MRYPLWFLGVVLLAQTLLGAEDLTSYVQVSPRDSHYFQLSNGRPYIPIGLNMIAPDGAFGRGETNGLRRMDDWFAKLAAQGGNFARIWISSDFWEVEHEQAGVYDAEKARRLDALLEMAQRRGIRLKLTLEHFREMSEKPRQAWANKLLYHTSRGGPATNMADFFSGTASRDRFKAKLDWFSARYGSNPIIFGWELWNEINAVSGGKYMEWTELMLPELKRRFPNNLAMQSLGSFDSNGSRDHYERLTRMPGNEVAQVHRYLDLGAAYTVCHGPMDILAADAVSTLLSWNPERPVLLAESGAVEPRHTGPFKLYRKDLEGILLHDVLFAPFFAGAAGPGHCWHWGEYVDRNNLWHQFARFAETVKDIDPSEEHFRPLRIEHPRLRVYVLQGKMVTLLWCRDGETTWQTELEADRPPDLLQGVRLNVARVLPTSGELKARAYDPWRNQWSDLKGTDTLDLPDFRRSLVLIISSAPD